MKKSKQTAFSLVFGVDLDETTPATPEALQKVGEYPDGTLKNILFLTTDPELILQRISTDRVRVLSAPRAKTYVLRNTPERFSNSSEANFRLKYSCEVAFRDFLYNYITLGSKSPDKPAITWERKYDGTFCATYPAKYIRPQMFTPEDLQTMLDKGEVLFPTKRDSWALCRVRTLPDTFAYPEPFVGLSCPLAEAYNLVAKLYSDGVLARHAGKNATHFFILSLKKYSETKHPTDDYGKFLPKRIHSELTCHITGKVPLHKVKYDEVADVLDCNLLFNKDGYLYPKERVQGTEPTFNILTVKDKVFADGAILTCDKESSGYAIFTNTSERYIPHSIRIKHLANRGYIAVKRSDLDQCQKSKSELASEFQQQYNLADSETHPIDACLQAGRVDLLHQDIALAKEVKDGKLVLIDFYCDRGLIPNLYYSFLSGNYGLLDHIDPLYYRKSGVKNLFLHILGDKPFAKYTARGDLLVPYNEVWNISNYIPFQDKLAELIPGINALLASVLENQMIIRQNLLQII